MKEEIEIIQKDALAAIAVADDESSLDDARVAFLGRKGRLTIASAGMKDLSKEDKPVVGQLLNVARQAITSAIEEKQSVLAEEADKKSVEGIDLTLPARGISTGALHPITQVKDSAIQTLRRMGFALAEGPEIETELHCFDALNTPEDHPARNEKDTFYFDSGKLLRTHTSSVQIRTMEKATPPVRIICLLYTSPSPRDLSTSRMPSSA